MTQPAPPRTPAEVVSTLNAFSTSLASVVDQYNRLSGDMEKFEKGRKVREAEQEKRERRRFWGLAALVTTAVLVAGLSGFNSVKASQTADLLSDCVVPGGECYKRGTKRTGSAIEELDRRDLYGNIAIIQCVRDLGPGNDAAWDKAFTACVIAKRKQLVADAAASPGK